MANQLEHLNETGWGSNPSAGNFEVMYIKETEECLVVSTKDKDMFGGVLDTGFNGMALASTRWLEAYERFLRAQGVISRKLNCEDVRVQRFVFGNGNHKDSTKKVWLPIYFGGKYHHAQCRLIEGNTELLLGRLRCEENGAILAVRRNEIQFGKTGCWEKLRMNTRGHLALSLDPQ